ncbi:MULTISPECIES: cell wall-binding protein [unclassified Lacrimispora]|uniref:cell wall-binding protein n=1 Tax=unclassified Lacrimispora TaxID=2719232 RepID=UPI00376F70F2
MRKQTKLVAVLSTAALLALGASMSSFAATGWQEENGTWVYYDKNGDLETEKWEKSGDNWFYLNDDGEMTTDAIVEYNDNYYYVDANGAMVTNQWASVENDNYDGDSENEPVNHWYYFGSNGKAFKASTNSTSPSFKTINGKKYTFDSEGKMLFGWIGSDGERKTDDNAWRDGLYYAGDENDGAMATGWRFLDIVDDSYDKADAGKSSINLFDDENQTRWFYFKDSGKKMAKEDGKTINGKKYSFDEDGRMNAEWVVFGATPDLASKGSVEYTESWRFYGSPEDGARITKGWFKVVPDYFLNDGDYNDDSDAWYYADGNGNLVASKIKSINGKKYLFDEKGKMKSGLKFVLVDGKDVTAIAASDDDDYPYETESEYKDNATHWLGEGYQAYYFGSGDDGSMKTGKQTINLDGDNFNFLLNKSGGTQGAGKTGRDSDKIYLAGILLTADKDDKYVVVTNAGTKDATVLKADEIVKNLEVDATFDTKKYSEYYTVKDLAALKDAKLINTSGTVQKNKDKAKASVDYCFKLEGEKIVAIYLDK